VVGPRGPQRGAAVFNKPHNCVYVTWVLLYVVKPRLLGILTVLGILVMFQQRGRGVESRQRGRNAARHAGAPGKG
jgi:hypothetical protein